MFHLIRFVCDQERKPYEAAAKADRARYNKQLSGTALVVFAAVLRKHVLNSMTFLEIY